MNLESKQVLAIEPYYGGSHRAFLDGWTERSRHRLEVWSLPAHAWKWRMRHAAITFARRAAENETCQADVVFCSDMLSLAEFRGLAPPRIAALPAIVYFHENQLTYPVREFHERDFHFAMTNIASALAADAVWFNSEFHRREFLAATREFLGRMPDFQPVWATGAIADKSSVVPPGVAGFAPRGGRSAGPLRVLWAARWEHDKDPETFFEALRLLDQRGVDFRLSVLGESFSEVPAIFARAETQFTGQIDRWGFQEGRADYAAALAEADVFVSTAQHEFFGIAAVEAISAGAFPLLPRRLAYPELLPLEDCGRASFFYEDTAEELALGLAQAAQRLEQDNLWQGEPDRASRQVERYAWDRVAAALDDGVQRLIETRTAPRRSAGE